MLQFLPMLMKGMQGAGAVQGAQGGGGLMEKMMGAVGASGGQNKSGKDIGMQYANAGLTLPQTPTAQQMLSQLPQNVNQQMYQRQAPQTFNPLLQMLMGGGK